MNYLCVVNYLSVCVEAFLKSIIASGIKIKFEPCGSAGLCCWCISTTALTGFAVFVGVARLLLSLGPQDANEHSP